MRHAARCASGRCSCFERYASRCWSRLLPGPSHGGILGKRCGATVCRSSGSISRRCPGRRRPCTLQAKWCGTGPEGRWIFQCPALVAGACDRRSSARPRRLHARLPRLVSRDTASIARPCRTRSSSNPRPGIIPDPAMNCASQGCTPAASATTTGQEVVRIAWRRLTGRHPAETGARQGRSLQSRRTIA